MSTPDKPIDLSSLRERAGGDEALVSELLELLRATLPGQRADIARAVEEQDFLGVSRAAHALKGGAGSMAAGPVAAGCGALEAAGKAGDLAAVSTAWQSLDREIARLADEVARLLEGS